MAVTTVLTSCDQLNLLTEAVPVTDVKSSVDSVKRCLFGVADRQATCADLAALRRQLDAQSRQRWNFDFRSGTPLTSTFVGGGGARWVWTRVTESWRADTRPSDSESHRQRADCRRRTHEPSSPSPRRPVDNDRASAAAAAVKKRRMSLNPSLEVKAKVTGSELKVVSRRKSVGAGLERRRSLRSTTLLGSPSRMFIALFLVRYKV